MEADTSFSKSWFFFFAWKLQFYQVRPAVLLEVRGSLWPFSRQCPHIPASGPPESVSGSPHPNSRTVLLGEQRLVELRTWHPLLPGLQLTEHSRAPGIREQVQDLPHPFHAIKTVLGMTLLYGWGFQKANHFTALLQGDSSEIGSTLVPKGLEMSPVATSSHRPQVTTAPSV